MRRISGFMVMAAVVLVVMVAVPTAVQADEPHVVMPVKHGVSQPLRDLPPIRMAEEQEKPEEVREVNSQNAEISERLLNAEAPSGPVDTAVQNYHFENNMPVPTIDFEGIPNVNGVLPPDTTGDVGPNHYVQWVNLSYAVFDKTGGVLAGPFNGNALWAGFGGSCEGFNSGDPIVLYDHIADRWFMSQFTGDNHQCIAVSQTADPTGAWYLYDYLADAGSGFFPDYPKFGVWPDGYYYSANMFTGSFQGGMAGVFERDQMLVGGPAQFIWFFTPETNVMRTYSRLPPDVDGMTMPPAGAPAPFLIMMDDAWAYDPPFNADVLVVEKFHVDWATPGNSTFTVTDVIDVGALGYPFDTNLCGYSRNCIPQPGGAPVDALSSRIMFKLQYRNFGTHETLVTSQTVDEDGADHAGVRWYELREAGSGWGLHQASTFAPDSDHRFVGDLAMDASGNIAVGYSVSSSTTFPGIRWAGRLEGDPLDTLAQGEATVIAGSGYQTHSSGRWGDYSTMSVDPVDDCTFWYTQEYYESVGTAPWQTRIAAFKFPGCTTGATGTVEGTVINSATLLPIEGATVEVGGFGTSTNAAGFYSIDVPEDTYDVTASAFGYTPQTVMGIVVTDGGTTVQDFALDPVGDAFLDGYVTGNVHGWPLYAMIDITSGGMPIATAYTNPFNGYYVVGPLPIGTPYDLEVTSLIPGYVPAMRGIVLAPAGQTESFVLANDGSADWVRCILDGGIVEYFEGDFPPPGWLVFDDSGSGMVWMRNDQWGESNHTGGGGFAAHIDSDNAGSGAGLITTTLVSPFVQLPASPAKGIRFLHDFNELGSDQVWFDISDDGGTTWTTLYTHDTGDATGQLNFDLSAYAGMMVQFRWIYTDGGSWAWWWQIDNVETYELPPPPPPPYMTEEFEGTFPPAGWTSVDNIASGMVWNRNDLIPSSNRTGNNGFDAGADSDATCGVAPWDTTLFSGPVDLTGTTAPEVSFQSNFQDYAGSGQGWFDISNDGGMSWTNLWYGTSDDPGGTGGGGVLRSFDLTSYVGDTVQFSWRYTDDGDTCAWFWHIDNVLVAEPGAGGVPPDPPPPLNCGGTPGSLVEGFVSDANTFEGINGATVANDIGGVAVTMATPDDVNIPDGFYWMFTELPLGDGPSTRTFTASAPNYAESMVEVNLVPDTVNQLDFALGAGWLEITPDHLEARLYSGMTESQMLEVLNWGVIEANVALMVAPVTSGWAPSAPVVVPPPNPEPASVERDPAAGAGEVQASEPNPNLLLAGAPAYAVELWASEFVNWPDVTVPGTWTVITGGMASYYAGDFLLGDFSELYVVDDINNFGTLDTTTGAFTSIGTATPGGGESWTGITASGGGTLYASATTCAASTLYTIDPATGAATPVGPITDGPCIIDIAINAAGQMYGVDIIGDVLVQIEPSTGAGTVIGPTGFAANYAQGMDFDEVEGVLYWASYGGGGDGALRIIDTMTSASTPVGDFPGSVEVASFAVASFAGGGVPWLVLTPDEGVVPPADGEPGLLPVNAEFLADGANHFGLYRATISAMHDTPYDVNDVSVCFTKAFDDVSPTFWGDDFIHSLAGARISQGCGGADFCPTDVMIRNTMARWLVKAYHGPDFTPIPCAGTFGDVVCETTPNANYIEQIYADEITTGCSTDPLLFCPYDTVNRAQMATFITRLAYGPTFVPPPATGMIFPDVPAGYWAAPYIEWLYNEGIVDGFPDGTYRPTDPTSRAQMAKMVVISIGLPMCNGME